MSKGKSEAKGLAAQPHVLLIDNFDSFSFNLVDAFRVLDARVDVYRNLVSANRILEIAREHDTTLIAISPGPGTPHEAGCCIELIQRAAGSIPLFGVCLGHQAITCAFGGTVGSADAIVHGKKSRIGHSGHELFAGVPTEFDVGRYHSLVARRLPNPLCGIAHCGQTVMALAHERFPVYGVQFHPESILTTHGQRLMSNVLRLAERARIGESH
jgi:anthranilate synthase component 2